MFDTIIKVNTTVVMLSVIFSSVAVAFPDEKPQVGIVAGASDVQVQETLDPSPTQTPTPLPTATPTPIPVTDPIHINIPAINVDTDVIHVGVTPENIMEVPADFSQVGWFDRSQKPGEDGSHAAIMSGHFDRSDGSPAVFYLLQTLEPNDEVFVTSTDGRVFVFAVEEVFSHPLDGFPSDIVYGPVPNKSLKLITCDGIWSASKKAYSNRLVVTTRFVREDTEAPQEASVEDSE